MVPELLVIIVLMPFAGFLILAIFGRFMKRSLAGLAGAGSIGISAVLTIILGIWFLRGNNGPFTVHLWQWIDVADLRPDFAFQLDSLSLVFIFVITFVGFLIHIYSLEYMHSDEDYSRFFAYMNLFVGSMLILVLADNFLLLYLGWEGVGLCSFLLIGFWYKTADNNAAAGKAFIVTRVGDTAMAIGLFLLYVQFHTLNIKEIMQEIPVFWKAGSPVANAAAFLLLGGAVGKSAQLPLQTWLPDAMAGPTPVSALIHAATMVTAGVYLIARSHVLYLFSPAASLAVAVVGAVTLLIAGLSAIVQSDIKKVLAYSTMSQIGYMFLGLGVGAWSAAIFHFMIHAFFKALLFLGAGVVILAMNHERDMFKMGGLRKKLPVTFWTFIAGSASLSALPLVTAGFYSKDQILFYALESTKGSLILWLAGIIGAFITAIYTFRMVFTTFYGPAKHELSHTPGMVVKSVLLVLAFLSLTAGFINMPESIAHIRLFSGFLSGILPPAELTNSGSRAEVLPEIISGVLVLAGIYTAYIAFRRRSRKRARPGIVARTIYAFLLSGFGFDQIYNAIIVKPAVLLSRINRKDFIDGIYTGIARFTLWFNRKLVVTQSGMLSWYVMGIAFGAIVILTLILAI